MRRWLCGWTTRGGAAKTITLNPLKPNYRAALAFAHDVLASAVCWVLAFWLRLNLEIPEEFLPPLAAAVTASVPLHALIFWSLGLYRGSWRYASLPDLKRIALACLIGALAVPALLAFFRADINVPRSTFILAPLLLAAIMSGSRIAYRAWKERSLYGNIHLTGEPVLVIGAGDVTVNLLREMERSSQWRAIGILDDDPTWHGQVLLGVKVLGGISEVGRWAQQLDSRHAIISLPGSSAGVRRRAAELAGAAGLTVLTVPSYDDLLSGKVTVSQIRRIELEDLLGRDQVVLDDRGLHQLLTGRVVMVTGAGGSIGSELARQIAKFEPALLVLFDLNEYALYSIEQEFGTAKEKTVIAPIIGDVRNTDRVQRVLSRFKPVVIFHAAAYKHVPLMETDNAWEAAQNNVLGTLRLARAARDHGVEKFVLISTDKAVNPTNVMGATKRLSEQVCQSLQRSGGTRFLVVRFGNVLGSTGSVIPKFREQIARGGPLTVTHPEITRYFMSIPEAAQLVLQAGLMGRGGEIFVLEMGEPVRIVDLARDMIRLSGFSEEDINIQITGLRPGEKLYEELLSDRESTLPTPHPKLRIAKAGEAPGEIWLAEVEAWLSQPHSPNDDEVKRDLGGRVPEYRPAAGGSGLHGVQDRESRSG
ncbi:MAG TPA: nucleoside-diphosphate sugar epimerase/dehydratase [Burkholderiales bacterium]|nr:nucleoside-diphosphate sugar epimerase/dehydratase [Burkholderiales bacterium]